MPKTIKVKLGVDSFNELLDRLNTMEKEIERAKEASIKEVANESINVILLKTPVDTGATASSTHIEEQPNKIILVQEGDHVFENEFGDGLLGKEYPYPEPIPGGYTFTHEKDYYFTPTDSSSKYYQDNGRGKPRELHSQGQVASAQMYHGAQYVRENLPKRIKQRVRDIVSKT